MSIISFQSLAIGVLLSCATMYVVKYVDVATINILKNKKLTKTLISIDVLILIAVALLLVDRIIGVFQQISILLNLR